MMKIGRPCPPQIQPFNEKDGHNPSVHVVTDVILIDETEPLLEPVLYSIKCYIWEAFKSNDLPKENPVFIEEEIFDRLGEILHIDREKKLITLKNLNKVFYKHIIIATGKKRGGNPFSHQDFQHGFYALLDAIRIRLSKPHTGMKLQRKKETSTPHATPFSDLCVKGTVASMAIGRAVNSMIHAEYTQPQSDLNGIDRPLYLVSLCEETYPSP